MSAISAIIPKNAAEREPMSFHLLKEKLRGCSDLLSGTKTSVNRRFFFRSRTFSLGIGASGAQSTDKIVHNITKISKKSKTFPCFLMVQFQDRRKTVSENGKKCMFTNSAPAFT